MDRRRFIATVGVASAAAAVTTALEENWAHAEPSARPAQRPPAEVDDRFLDMLTRVNDLQVPVTLSATKARSTRWPARGPWPRARCGWSARTSTRAVSDYHDAALLGPVQHPAGRAGRTPEPERSVRHRQPGQPAGHLVRDQRSRPGLRAAGRRRPAGHRGDPPARTQRSCAGRARALAEGGVHTPNHRWEICKALAHLYHLWPSRAAVGPDQRLAGRGHRPGR